MIKTKQELIKKIRKIADSKIEQGIQLRNLAGSINQRKDEKTLKEWIKFCLKVIELEGGRTNGN